MHENFEFELSTSLKMFNRLMWLCDKCDNLWRRLLQTQALSVGQVNEPYIGLTQENSIESSVQDCLPYIPKPHGLC